MLLCTTRTIVKTMSVHFAVMLVLLLAADAAEDWMNQPYESEADFNYEVLYNDNFTLDCSQNGSIPKYWIRPDMIVMQPGHREYFPTVLDGPAGWEVDDNVTMHIINVQEDHFGFYYCVLENGTGNMHAIKKAVNFEGAYFGSLWEIYDLQTIIGLSSALGFLVACLAVYIPYRMWAEETVAPEDITRKKNASFSNGEIDLSPSYTDLKFRPEIQSTEL